MSGDVGDNAEELVFIPRAMGNLWRALAGDSDGYVRNEKNGLKTIVDEGGLAFQFIFHVFANCTKN